MNPGALRQRLPFLGSRSFPAIGESAFWRSTWQIRNRLDATTGRYSHEALERILGSEGADRTLCNSHHQVFSEWLRFSLAEQKADLDEYLRATGSPRQALHYHDLVPRTARDVERQLYLTDLETLLELLKFEHGGAFWIREA